MRAQVKSGAKLGGESGPPRVVGVELGQKGRTCSTWKSYMRGLLDGVHVRGDHSARKFTRAARRRAPRAAVRRTVGTHSSCSCGPASHPASVSSQGAKSEQSPSVGKRSPGLPIRSSLPTPRTSDEQISQPESLATLVGKDVAAAAQIGLYARREVLEGGLRKIGDTVRHRVLHEPLEQRE